MTSSVHAERLSEDAHTDVIPRKSRLTFRPLPVLPGGGRHSPLADCYSIIALRIRVGVVYLGFGILKYFPGVSAAQDLALATTHLLSFGLVPPLVPETWRRAVAQHWAVAATDHLFLFAGGSPGRHPIRDRAAGRADV
jgi:hypothetical protein